MLLQQQHDFLRQHQLLEQHYQRELAAKQQRIDFLYEQFLLLRHQRFGVSAEHASGQRGLFEEAEAEVVAETPVDATAAAIAAGEPCRNAETNVSRGGRKPLPAELPRLDIVHELSEHERRCACGCQKELIGEECSEQLDIVPMQLRVLRHIRKKYACRRCETAPVVAPLPAQPIPKSNAAPGLLAMLLTTKYVDGLPLHRFERVLARSGVDIPRQTLARWVIQVSEQLQPLHNLLRDALLSGPVVHCDETVVQVLKEPDKPPASPSYMWVQTGGPPKQKVVLYDYHPSRSGQVPLRLLEGYRGYLMTDGYEGYNAIAARDGIIHLCCLAHARRKFVEAQRVQSHAKTQTGKAEIALDFIGTLYGIERRVKDADTETRYRARQSHSVPVLQQLRRWLDTTVHSVPPKSKLGEALLYLDKYWTRLSRYTERGDLPIDNNAAENAIRPFVIGRKAWLFSDTPRGANASALIYSLIETVKANGLEPYTYLRRVLRDLPQATTVEAIEALLPWRLTQIDLITELES